MTDDPVALSQWYPVADSGEQPPAYSTSLLGHPVRISFAAERARITARSADGHELRELPVTERFGLIWTTLGEPATQVFDFPEAHEPGRRYLRCGWVTLHTSAPRIVENFLDTAHFRYVHPGVPGPAPAEVRFGDDHAWSASAALASRVPSPFQAMRYRVSPVAPDQFDAIVLAVHPL